MKLFTTKPHGEDALVSFRRKRIGPAAAIRLVARPQGRRTGAAWRIVLAHRLRLRHAGHDLALIVQFRAF